MNLGAVTKTWKCRTRTVSFSSPYVMAILNVTPDSFHIASRVNNTQAALQLGLRFQSAGAAILDIGGESTRPGATPLSPTEEQARVIPVIAALRAALPDTLLSVDTRHTATAQAAIHAGVDIINDVSGCAPEAGMLELIAESGAGYVLTHAKGLATVEAPLSDPDTCTDIVIEELLHAAQIAEAAGVAPEQIQLDPGLGFAKTNEVSSRLLQDTARFAALPYSLMIGASRKRFLGMLTGQTDPMSRGAASIGAALLATVAGANVLRVHDVRETIDALSVFSLLYANKDE